MISLKHHSEASQVETYLFPPSGTLAEQHKCSGHGVPCYLPPFILEDPATGTPGPRGEWQSIAASNLKLHTQEGDIVQAFVVQHLTEAKEYTDTGGGWVRNKEAVEKKMVEDKGF